MMGRIKKLQAIALACGIALFVYLIYKVGVWNILESIRFVGINFLVLIAVSGFRQLIRTVAWMKCIEGGHRTIGLFELFNVRLAGEAIRYLSFTGPFLGEPSKAALLRNRLPLVEGISSLIVEHLTYSMGAALVTLSGLVLLLGNFTLNRSVKVTGLFIGVFMIVAAVAIQRVIARRRMVLTNLMQRLEKLTGRAFFQKKAESVRRMEENIHGFYINRSSTFFLVLMLELTAHFVNILEVYLIIRFIGVEATLLSAFIVEAMTKVVNFTFFFVPGQVGVFEGSSALMLEVLGPGAAAGVKLALIEKIRNLAWTAYGLAILALAFRQAPSTSPEIANKKGEEAAMERPIGIFNDKESHLVCRRGENS